MNEDATARSRPNTLDTAQTSARLSSSSPLRSRVKGGPSVIGVGSPPERRRSSMFSDSVDGPRQSFRSSTDDFFLPKPRGPGMELHHEPSHWHSAPLALALLPAVGGMLFTNGSAMVTDLTLLGLAAVFLNWSVRVPWNWYCSAQSIRLRDINSSQDFHSDNVIFEESSGEEKEMLTEATEPLVRGPVTTAHKSVAKEDAASELRHHEIYALFACFLFPLVGVWLLHAIRGQLSRPSEGLVSNYNLTIFLLASELRPLSHLVTMIQSRTIFLQHVVNANPFDEKTISTDKLSDLITRFDELEAHVADSSAKAPTGNASMNASMQIEVRKALQPDVDALNRAIRRYEKRTTVLAMQTESRLQDLETRMNDAITLAAAAERTVAQNRHGSASVLLDWACAIIVLPTQAAWAVLGLPARVAKKVYGMAEGYVSAKIRREMKRQEDLVLDMVGPDYQKRRGGAKRSYHDCEKD